MNRRHHGYPKMAIRDVGGNKKSGREDLNLRPHGPEPCALAGLRYAPNSFARLITTSGKLSAHCTLYPIQPDYCLYCVRA